MSVKRVYLIRHGETEWNATGRWQGVLPVDLNETGYDQARKLAAYLANEPIQGVSSSDLSRASETARILALSLGVKPKIDMRWRELDIGIFQGLTFPEINQRYPENYQSFSADPVDYVIPEGESRRQLQMRALNAWNEAVTCKDAEQIAIVTHGGTLKMLMSGLYPNEFDVFQAQHFPNTSFTILDWDDDIWRISALAQTPHLNTHGDIKGDAPVYF